MDQVTRILSHTLVSQWEQSHSVPRWDFPPTWNLYSFWLYLHFETFLCFSTSLVHTWVPPKQEEKQMRQGERPKAWGGREGYNYFSHHHSTLHLASAKFKKIPQMHKALTLVLQVKDEPEPVGFVPREVLTMLGGAVLWRGGSTC